MARPPKYSDEERAAALAAFAANQGNLSQTASQCEIPRNTIRRWLEAQQESQASADTVQPAFKPATEKKDPAEAPLPPRRLGFVELVPQAAASLADKLEKIAHKLADILPDKIERASLQQCAVSLGIAIEKMRLLREQSTANTASTLRLEYEELLKLDHDELLRKYRAETGTPAMGRN